MQNPKTPVFAAIIRTDGGSLMARISIKGREASAEILLVKDEDGRLALPGGFANQNESQEVALRRIVEEQTGLRVEPVHLAYGFSRVDPPFACKAKGEIPESDRFVWMSEADLFRGPAKLPLYMPSGETEESKHIMNEMIVCALRHGDSSIRSVIQAEFGLDDTFDLCECFNEASQVKRVG